jgi:plastocyanin
MKKSTLAIIIAVVAVVAIGAVVLATRSSDNNNNETAQPSSSTSSSDTATPADEAPTADTNESQVSENSQANAVTIQNFSYNPATITVKKGTKVTWTNKDSTKHDVTPDTDGAFPKSELLGQNESYSHTFDTAGTFSYHCSPHPYMKGTIVVTE